MTIVDYNKQDKIAKIYHRVRKVQNMKKKLPIIGLLALITVLLTGAILVVMLKLTGDEEANKEPVDITMFSAYTDVEEFKNVPAMVTEQGKVNEVVDAGNKNYLIDVSGSTVEEYKTYLKTLEAAGFKKHSDNGEDAMEGYALTASYKKDNLTLTVSHAISVDRTYISASYDLALSDHLIYNEKDAKSRVNANTKVHMLQMVGSQGCSYIIQLKNGHFVVHDGGMQQEAANFMDYMTGLVPKGEKPVIEGWFISHCHNDHYGVLTEIVQNQAWLNQIYVNGFYYVEPSQDAFNQLTTQSDPSGNMILTRAYKLFKTQDGGRPEFYRPQFGQRYYFSDVMIDVCLTLEQLPMSAYLGTDFNDTSFWLMHHIDGQRMLFSGDASTQSTYVVTEMYDREYFDMDIFIPFHHGINVYDHFTDYCTYDVILYPSFRDTSIWDTREDLGAKEENENLKSKAKEVHHYGDGGVVLTFPYKLGTAEKLEDIQDIYKPL